MFVDHLHTKIIHHAMVGKNVTSTYLVIQPNIAPQENMTVKTEAVTVAGFKSSTVVNQEMMYYMMVQWKHCQ